MKRLIALMFGALVLVAAPVVYGDRDRDRGDHKKGGDLKVVGLTADNRLIKFEDDDPGDAETIGRISGLAGDTKLVGVDYRPASGNDGDNGDLYGLGDRGGIYTLSTRTAKATKRAQTSQPLAGSSFGVDFNPVVDRLRVISDTGQNLRVNVDDGATIADTPLSYPPAAPPATGVTGAAYTNNDSDANTATTLFDIDTALDQVSIQSPANSGQLVSTGKLRVDSGAATGSDIYSTVRNGTTVGLDAFVALTVGGASRFYEIDLLTGRADSQGSFSSKNQVTGIAIPLNQK